MRKLVPLCLMAAFLATVAVPAGAQETGPTFRTERAYFTCLESNKVQNIPMLNGEIPTWDTTAPGSAATGNGCGMYENNVNAAGLNLDVQGTFTGNLDSFTVELHNLGQSQTTPDGTLRMIATLVVDDECFADTGSMAFPVVPGVGPGHKITYTFTGLHFDDELGDGTQEHTIFIQARSSQEDTQSLWVWGASEVPSGITFNPATLEATQIPVDCS